MTFDTATRSIDMHQNVEIIGDIVQSGDYSLDGDLYMQTSHKLWMTNSGNECSLLSNGEVAVLLMSEIASISATTSLVLSSPQTTLSGTLRVQGASTDIDGTLDVDLTSTFNQLTNHYGDIRFQHGSIATIDWVNGSYPAHIKAKTTIATAEEGGGMEFKHPVLLKHVSPKHHFNEPDLWGGDGSSLTHPFIDQYSVRMRMLQGVDEITAEKDGSFMHLAVSSDEGDWQHYVWAGATQDETEGNYLYSGT